LPEFIELAGVEEGDRLRDLPRLHLKVPGVGVVIRHAIVSCCGRVKKDDDGIAACLKASNRGNERLGHSGVERGNHFVNECLLIGISLR